MIRSAALLALAPLLSAAGPARQIDPVEGGCNLVSGPAVYVSVSGLKDRTGRLKVEIYPGNEEDFLKDDTSLKRERKPFRRVWVKTPPSGPVSLCIRAPGPGQWALIVTHDRDGKNKFNFWKDGAGLPSNAKLGRNRPKLRQALLNVPAEGGALAIRVQYLRGLGGFGTVD